MKKLYYIIFIIFFSVKLFGQSNKIFVVKQTLPDSNFQFVNQITGAKANDMEWEEVETFVNGFAKVYANGKWGFVDGSGHAIIKAQYEIVRNFSNHYAAVRKDSKWGFIDETGNVVIPPKYDIVYDFEKGITVGYANRKWFLINKKDATIKPLNVDIFYGFKNGLAKITSQGRSGIMNMNGDIVSMEPTIKTVQKKAIVKTDVTKTTQVNICPANIDFEFGNFANWTCDTGHVAAVGTTNVITVNASPPTANRHVIIPKALPSVIDPYGLFPINPPDGSSFALKLGNNVNGAQAERVSYLVNVPANAVDFYISYEYAVVFQDPGHLVYQQPRFQAQVLDIATNTYLPCASFEYVSGSGLPGFFDSPVDSSIKCKSWSSAFINLSAYAGKALLLQFTTADCTKGAHWGYAYLDVDGCNIAATAQYNCNPSKALLTSPPGFEFYNWYNNNFSTQIGSGQNMVLNNPPVPGSTLHVILVPYNGFGCSDTLDVPYTATLPNANAGPDVTMCNSKAATIGSPAVGGFSYAWSPSTFLSNPNLSNPIANPPSTTTYIVTTTDTANGCTAQDTVIVNINPKPVAGFTPGPAQCLAGNSFSFNNTSIIASGTLSYNWSFGDGTTSTNASPVHSYTTAGIYKVKLIVTSNSGCIDSITHNAVTVNGNPPVKTSNDISICHGNNTQLQTTGAQTYAWSPSLGLSCINCSNPTASPDSSATYIVMGIDSLGCPGYDTINITVFQPIKINASGATSICKLGAAKLQANGAAVLYSWSPAQSLNNPDIANPIATPDSTTHYRVVGFDGHSCFTDTAYVTVTLNTQPVAAFDPGPAQCLTGNKFTFTNASTITSGTLTYNWSFGDGTYSMDPNPVHSYANAGVYSVKLIATSNNGCKDSIVHPAVTVNGNPPVKTSNDLSICRGNNFQLQTNGAQTYEWSPAPGLSCVDCANPIAAPLVSSTYYVKGIDNNGCPGYDTVKITVFQPIKINVSPGMAMCQLQSVNLLANGSAVSYAWSPAETLSSSTIPNPVASPAATTNYRVIGYDSHNCFTDTGYITVTVNPNPTVNIGPDQNLPTGSIYQINPVTQNGPIVSWVWSPTNDLSCSTCPDPSITVKNNITYVATVQNRYGCTASDSITIRTFCEGSQVFIPNAFTPDGDGLNDILMVRATGIQSVLSFRIFSRWGELLFEKTNFPPNSPSYGWDGRVKGVKAPAEVYIYVAQVICDNMQTYTFKGNTSILK